MEVIGCRFDFVKGYDGTHVRDYVEATAPYFVIGEFWDTLSYEGALPKPNQDAHRQRTINWLNAAAGRATAFDVTLKGILHAVFEVRTALPTPKHRWSCKRPHRKPQTPNILFRC